jgi:hypothetical protein
MSIRTLDVVLPAIWASYLINGDASGLNDADIEQCDRDTEGLGRCLTMGDDTWFETYKGIGHDVASYMFAPPVAPKDAIKQILKTVPVTLSGAPVGRPNIGTRAHGFIYDRKVTLNSVGYDRGGAYWGVGKELRVKFNGALTWVRFYRK